MAKKTSDSRRQFLKTAVLSGAGLGLTGAFANTRAAADAAAGAQPAAKVPRKKLGSTGKDIPILVQGGAIAFDKKYDKILHRSFSEGVDYIDTALVYAEGQSHAGIAPFIKQVGREKLWITSKGPSRQATVESYTRNLDTCLQQLETEYLDLFFMHEVDDPRYLDADYIQMGERMRKSKKTTFFGFSCHGDRMVEVMNKAVDKGGIDVIMFRYNFTRYGDLELNKVVDRCKKAGIGLIAMKTQSSVPDDQKHVKEFQSKNFNLHQAKLKAVWADDRIDAAISHMDNTAKQAENIAAAKSGEQLTMGEFQQLQRIATASASLSCQGCSHICEPRIDTPVKVSKQLRYLMYHECYGEPDRARKLYDDLDEAERCIDGVDFTAATASCPQGIDIASRLEVARRKLGGTT